MAKPSKNHPWRKTSSNEVYNWAKTESNVSKVHEFTVGTLTPKQKTLNKKYPQM